ncbi:MAG TPA: chemotaxis protein CheA, partial [Limnobacter sp.]|nr:chemotaxis protein CheA [Limnobacter sp.]
LVSDLQAAVMKARMQPVGRVFQKYSRLARDVARQLGKDVELVIEGAETEVDKSILEELNDPLIHLVRNAVDHGIETIADRTACGKNPKGTVNLSARQTGDHIVIEIQDDGRGMKPEVIRDKAVEKGLISAEEAGQLNVQDSLQLIFLPGFSTKDQISDISGRGVGMDVVKTNIQRLNGRIEIESNPGEGSRITILLPLTLAILPVLMLKLEEQIYSLPLSCVREIIPIEEEKVQRVGGKPTMVVRGEVLPLLDLATLIGRPTSPSPKVGVLAISGNRACILAVDTLVGQDEVMIKPLDGVKPKGVAGATLSGEGLLVLVLELRELLEGRL